MKSKIFNSDQIRAIQDGRMTQFMQVVKPQPDLITNVIGGVTWQQSKDKYKWGSDTAELLSDMMQECPFGKIGDTLYCRETWAVWGYTQGEYIHKANGFVQRYGAWEKDTPHKPWDIERIEKWNPAATMPREAARLFLRITNIRVMRVQELDDEDFIKQGHKERSHSCGGFGYYEAGGEIQDCCCQSFDHSPIVMGFIDLRHVGIKIIKCT